MPTPFECAQINLQLYDLRREPVLREARAWFIAEFNPETFEDLISTIRSERNASFRMVLGYWDMAASLVTAGAVDAKSFLAAHNEIYAALAKIHPFLATLRQATSEPDIAKHMESVVLSDPEAEAIMKRRREAIRAFAKAQAGDAL